MSEHQREQQFINHLVQLHQDEIDQAICWMTLGYGVEIYWDKESESMAYRRADDWVAK